MTKHSKEGSERNLDLGTVTQNSGDIAEQLTQEVEKLEEIWQSKEAKADLESKHMPKEKAYRGHKG